MSEPIKVGDLVVVVRWPCCGYRLGHIFRVTTFISGLDVVCNNCRDRGERNVTVAWDGDARGTAAKPQWLKRIPPFPELQDERHDEEITA